MINGYVHEAQKHQSLKKKKRKKKKRGQKGIDYLRLKVFSEQNVSGLNISVYNSSLTSLMEIP